MIILLVGLMITFASAQFRNSGGSFSNSFSGSQSSFSNSFQYTQPSFTQLYSGSNIQNFWPILRDFDSEQCEATSDFVIGIPPGGCSPGVVRSDLLAEQNVPVFCELYAIKTNPLVDVSAIQSISFKGDYPEGVSGISYHPARAATRSYRTLLGDPLINNVGYVVIILKGGRVEGELEDWISGNLTATMRYDLERAFGVGRSDHYLKVPSEQEYEENRARSSFWRGSGFLKVRNIDTNGATIEVLRDDDRVLQTITLREGETSGRISMPGFYCKAGLRVRLNNVVSDDESALLNIDGEETWVRQGAQLLNGRCRVSSLDVEEDNSGRVSISCPGQRLDLRVSKIQDSERLVEEFLNGSAEEDFNEALRTVEELVDTYGLVEKGSGEKTYAEEALYEQIELASIAGKQETQARLMDLFIDSFPDSILIKDIRRKRSLLNDFDYEDSTEVVFVNDDYHTIGLVQLNNLSGGAKQVSLRVTGNPDVTVGEGDSIPGRGSETLRVERIEPGEVRISSTSKESQGISETIKEGDFGTVGTTEIFIRNIDVTTVAHLTILPEIQNTKTEANFTFGVGIEKRAIELSPQKTEKLLTNINDSLDRWNEINDGLGTTIKTWKAACFATSAFLMTKNVVSGFSGTGLARQKVMQEYKDICSADPKYSGDRSRDRCYNDYAEDISRDVEATAASLKAVNERIEPKIKSHTTEGGLFDGGSIEDREAYVRDLKGELKGDSWIINGQEVTQRDLGTSNQITSILLVEELEARGASELAIKAAVNERDLALGNVARTLATNAGSLAASQKIIDRYGGVPKVQSLAPSGEVRYIAWEGQTVGSFGGNVPPTLNDKKSSAIQFIEEGSSQYILELSDSFSGQTRGIAKAYRAEGDSWEEVTDERFRDVVVLNGGTEGQCSNVWKNPEQTAKVSFYESGASKGLPAIVPFDLQDGWYAMVTNEGASFLENPSSGYQASGAVRNFRICNIGPNGRMEQGQGDDAFTCQRFDINTLGAVDEFLPCPSLSPREVQSLTRNALEAIRQASQQYGNRQLRILEQDLKLGDPSSITGKLECQDFMSPQDCNIMFNVCDPVICPSSRCDLGGKLPVADVIQTGIVGGVMMCLPNAKEGIKVPICLSGIHAGLDSYISILEAEQACLQENLETGRLVGICDEITAVYKCEFFWKQAAPLLTSVIPKVFSGVGGGATGTKGGGEYLIVDKAFDNLGASLDFFKNTYAPNAFRAFNLRSVEEVGSEFCKAFIGTSVPTSASALEGLLEPESPPQFNAHFSETLFSEATLPATSHYKVFYHIYAGNERGAQYRVYLKNPPQETFYAATPFITIKQGFIPVGESATESIDLTFPQGYKELCVRINDQEECGFKSVSSSVALDILSSAYVADQAQTEDITSEEECVSGSPSLIPAATFNIQEGVTNAVNPDIALNGIVRICAGQNPNSGGRWKDVGHCGNPNDRCWLDTESVRGDLEKIQAVGEGLSIEAIDSVADEFLDGVQQNYEEVSAELSTARKEVKELRDSDLLDSSNSKFLEILGMVNEISGFLVGSGSGTNADKAEALAIRSTLFRLRTYAQINAGVGRSGAARDTFGTEDLNTIRDSRGLYLKLYGNDWPGDAEDATATWSDGEWKIGYKTSPTLFYQGSNDTLALSKFIAEVDDPLADDPVSFEISSDENFEGAEEWELVAGTIGTQRTWRITATDFIIKEVRRIQEAITNGEYGELGVGEPEEIIEKREETVRVLVDGKFSLLKKISTGEPYYIGRTKERGEDLQIILSNFVKEEEQVDTWKLNSTISSNGFEFIGNIGELSNECQEAIRNPDNLVDAASRKTTFVTACSDTGKNSEEGLTEAINPQTSELEDP